MFHESFVSIGKSKAVAGLKHRVSLYLWAYSIHNQRKMEGRSFLFFYFYFIKKYFNHDQTTVLLRITRSN